MIKPLGKWVLEGTASLEHSLEGDIKTLSFSLLLSQEMNSSVRPYILCHHVLIHHGPKTAGSTDHGLKLLKLQVKLKLFVL